MISNKKINELYKDGVNISDFLKNSEDKIDDSDIVKLSYEAQSGSYIATLRDKEFYTKKMRASATMAQIIQKFIIPSTLLEAGVGEGTTLFGVNNELQVDPANVCGFDLSWSRVALGKKWLEEQWKNKVNFCTGNMLDLPFEDNSFDVVYTHHSIEPNRGYEIPMMKELYRVTNNYLFLFEPSYGLANEEIRQRMDNHGYCQYLDKKAVELGYDLVDYFLLENPIYPMNPTSVVIIRKDGDASSKSEFKFACPQSKLPLDLHDSYYYSRERLAVYPIVGDIPCLRMEDAIITFKHDEYFGLSSDS